MKSAKQSKLFWIIDYKTISRTLIRVKDIPSLIRKWFVRFSNFQKVSVSILVTCTVVCLLTQSWLDLYKSSLTYIIPFSGILVTALLLSESIVKLKLPTRSRIRSVLIFGFSVVVTLFMYYCAGIFLTDTYAWVVSSHTPPAKSVPIVVILTLAIGLFLFWFRLRYRSLYGLHEALAGLGLAIYKTITEGSADKKSAYFIALLTACIYLVVRGLDNIQQGLKTDPYGKKVSKWLKEIGNSAKTETEVTDGDIAQ